MEVNDNAEAASAVAAEERKRIRSEIEFPYADLGNAVELAQTLYSKAGTSCEIEELAAWMNQSATGGTFRTRLSAGRIFGLLEVAQGRVTLTQLGRDIVGNSPSAKVTAFLSADLFRAIYEQNKGHPLPPAAAIQRQMEQLGVSPKQLDRARQTFMKSAQYAGFVDPSSGRFIKPGNGKEEQIAPPREAPDMGGGGTGGGGLGGGDLDLDPLLIELLKKIPAADLGWPGPQRLRWFRTFAMNVSQIYDDDSDPVELDIKLDKSAA